MFFFWLVAGLLVLEIGFLLFCVAWERPFAGLLSVAAVLLAFSWFLDWDLWSVVTDNPILILFGFAGYIAIGVAWSFPKWWIFVRDIRDKYLDAKSIYSLNIDWNDKQVVSAFKNRHKFMWDNQSIPPRASENKSRIFTWTMYWPLSLFWTLIDEPFKKVYQFIFNKIKNLYQGISDSAFANIE